MFEVVRKTELDKWGLKEENIIIPTRKTKDSAGYDFHYPKDYGRYPVIGPGEICKLPTGIKCKFPYSKSNLFLHVSVKSGFSARNTLMLTNGSGIIDKDYYDNPDNDGHILLSVYNYANKYQHKEAGVEFGEYGNVRLKSGEGIVQGIFIPYMTFREVVEDSRKGGFGSTSK